MNDEVNIKIISKRKHFYFIRYNQFYSLIIILYFILFISIVGEKHRILNNLLSEIHFVISGKGNQTLLNNTFYPEPYKVYVNSLKKDSCKRFCEMEYEINHVTLIFNETIEFCDNIFYGSENITEIDFSKFDFSKVKNMTFLLRNCKNLEKINFGNINTSSVVNMRGLFYNCLALTSLNISNFDTSLVTNMESMFYKCSSLTSIDVSNFNLLSEYSNINFIN